LPTEAQELWRDLQEAIRVVRKDSIYSALKIADRLIEALVKTYDLEEYYLRNQGRLRILSDKVVIDKKQFPCDDPIALRLLAKLKEVGPISRARLGELVYGHQVDEKTVRNHEVHLPPEIQELIQPTPSKGIELVYPPLENISQNP